MAGTQGAARLSTEQVAQRLGVKPETVYAYVSRGMLRSTRERDGRGSWFDPVEVERLAARTARRRPARSGEPAIRTELTLIQDGHLYYRGTDATQLARSQTYESAATWLWSQRLDPGARFTAPAEVVDVARDTVAALPAAVRLTDRLRVIAGVAASADRFRFHTEPEAVADTGATLLAAMVDALPLVGPGPQPGDRRLAARLWPRLTAEPARPEAVDALNGALVLLADHDLAASTVAARVAASTRAHPYAVVAAGLSASEGPLHGGASTRAYHLIRNAVTTGDPVGVYSESLRTEGRVDAFAHPLYPDGDPRAQVLLALLRPVPGRPEVRAAVDGLISAAAHRSPSRPNIDFALAVLAHTCGMTADAGEAVFAVARTAGWIAHAIEEYREPGLRFRFHGTYTGPAPA